MTIQERLAQLDWKAIEASLWQRGYAKIEPLLMAEELKRLLLSITRTSISEAVSR